MEGAMRASVACSNGFDFAGKDGRHRGLFPIPMPSGVSFPVDGGRCSRSVVRRLQSLVLILTSGCGTLSGPWTLCFVGMRLRAILLEMVAQPLASVLAWNVWRMQLYRPENHPASQDRKEALSELRSKLGYHGESSSLVPLDINLISLPEPGSMAARIEQILGRGAESFIKRLESKLSPESVVRSRKAASSLKTLYYDLILRVQPRKYAEFCRKLHACGLIEFHQTVIEEVGAFCVRKKNNRQRLVIDSRLANMWFEAPEPVQLCTGSTFSRIEVGDQGEPVEVGGVDITDAFYNIGLPPGLRKYFGLKPVKAGNVGIARTVEGSVRPSDMIYPVLRVVPMGWTHALWVCQRCHEMVIDGIPRMVQGQRICDRKPPQTCFRCGAFCAHWVCGQLHCTFTEAWHGFWAGYRSWSSLA